MPGEAINIGSIVADLDVNSGKMERGLSRGENALKAFENRIKELTALLDRGAIGLPEFTAQILELDRAAADIATRMQTANTAIAGNASAVDLMNAKMRQGVSGTRGLSQALMQIGYAADDLQYGLVGVLNQIQPAAQGAGQALGASATKVAAWAAGTQIAAVVAYQLYRHWDDLLEVMGSGKIKTEAEEMAELAKQSKLTADQAERLARFKAVEGKDKELRESKTESEKKSEEVATKAVVEADIKHVRQGVIATAPELLDTFPDVVKAKKALEDAQSADASKVLGLRAVAPNDPAAVAAKEEAVDKARKALLDARQAAAEFNISADTLTKFFKGGPAQLAALVKKNPAAFGPHNNALLAGLENAQKEADLTGEDRQRKEFAKKIGKVFDGFKKAFDAEVEKQAAKDAKVDEKALQHRIRAAVPDLQRQADRLAEQEVKGAIERGTSLKRLVSALVANGIAAADAAKAAKAAMEKTDEEEPDVRAKRLKREADAKAREAVPDLQHRADVLADKVSRGEMSPEQARDALAGEIKQASGVEDPGKAEADFAADLERRGDGKENAKDKAKSMKAYQKVLDDGNFSQADKNQAMLERLGRWGHSEGQAKEIVDAEEARRKAREERAKGVVSDEDARSGADAELDRAQKENPFMRARRLRRDAIAQAEEAVPDFGKQVDAAVVAGMVGAVNPEDLAKQFKAKLEAEGMKGDDAELAVSGAFQEHGKAINDHLSGLQREGMRARQEAPSRSEVYASSELTNRVQAGVTNGPDKAGQEQLAALNKGNEYLKSILEKIPRDGFGGWEVH